MDNVTRTLLADQPRVTRLDIDWSDPSPAEAGHEYRAAEGGPAPMSP